MNKREGRYIKDYKKPHREPEELAAAPVSSPVPPPPPAPDPGPGSAKAVKARAYYAHLAPGTYFQFKGGIPALGLVFFLALSLGGNLLWGALYGHLTFHNPVPLLGFIITIVFGIVLAGTVIFGSIAGKIFSLRLMTAAALGSSLTAVYMSWMVFAHDHFQTLGINDWVWRPLDLLVILGDVLAGGRPLLVKWFRVHEFLGPVWAVESVAAVVLGVSVVYAGMMDSCVCLSCRSWSESRFKGRKFGYAYDERSLKQRLEAWDLAALAGLGPPADDAWSEVSLEICPDCGEIGFLRVDLAKKANTADGIVENQLLLKGLMLSGARLRELESLAGPKA